MSPTHHVDHLTNHVDITAYPYDSELRVVSG